MIGRRTLRERLRPTPLPRLAIQRASRTLFAFATIVGATIVISSAVARPHPVIFGGDLAYPPYEWSDQGRAKGFLIDIEDALGSAGNRQVLHRLGPWPEVIQGLRTGSVDVVPMFNSAERERDFWFSEPLAFVHHAIFTIDDPGAVRNLETLGRWSVAIEASSFAYEQLSKQKRTGELVLVSNTQQAVAALADGRASYALLSSGPATRLARQMNIPLKRVGAPLWPREYAFAVRKDRPDLIAWVQENLAQTISSGEFQKISDRWASELEPLPPETEPQFLRNAWPFIAGISTALFGLLILFLRQLSHLASERKRRAKAERDAVFLFEHDPVTELPRRRRFEIRSNAVLANNGDHKTKMIALKVTNHLQISAEKGDETLIHCLQLIAGELNRISCLAGHVSENTFAVLISGDGHSLIDQLAPCARQYNVELDLVWGLAFFPQHGADAAGLLRRATIALQAAATNGRRWQIYDPALEPAPERTKILRDFSSFGKNDLFAAYQPQLDLASGRITAAEALVRWRHPEHGLIPPDQFIPQLEQAGLVGEVTIRMIDEAVRQSVVFRERGRPIQFSVNVSARDFVDRDLPILIETKLNKYGGRAEDLTVELTESGAVSDAGTVRAVLESLKRLGVGSAIDDFGTGFSSLASFAELAFDELKIDRIFVERMTSSESHHAAVSAAISMAHRMRLTVVAEGAPDLATIQLLRESACDRVQSHAVAKPMSGDDLIEFVSTFSLADPNTFHQRPTSIAASGQ